jgi:hypothetical protein
MIATMAWAFADALSNFLKTMLTPDIQEFLDFDEDAQMTVLDQLGEVTRHINQLKHNMSRAGLLCSLNNGFSSIFEAMGAINSEQLPSNVTTLS